MPATLDINLNKGDIVILSLEPKTKLQSETLLSLLAGVPVSRPHMYIHRLCMVLALAKEQPFVLIVHRSNVDFCVSLVVVAPVRANARVQSRFVPRHSSAKMFQ